MALTYPKRGYAGASNAGTLSTALSNSTLSGTFSTSTSLVGWSDVRGNAFTGAQLVLSFGYGTATEEKILVTFDNNVTFTIVSRGYDGTTAQSWPVGTTFILVASASELAEANDAVQSLKTILANTGTTTAPTPISYSSSTAGDIGSGTTPAAIDHSHNISASTLNSWLIAGASGAVASGVTIPASQVTNLPASANVAYAPSAAVSVSNTANNTPQLNAVVNPSGTFANYALTIHATLITPPSGTTDVHAILLYRVAGSGGTWLQGSDVVLGSAGTGSLIYTRLGGTAVWPTALSGTDYEFQLAVYCTNSRTGLTLTQFNLLVVGTN